MPGRIETYTHSDNSTKNKAGSLVSVLCQTDFAAKTEAFINFAKLAAKFACAYQIDDPDALMDVVIDAEGTTLGSIHKTLQEEIKETVLVEEIHLSTVGRPTRANDLKYIRSKVDLYNEAVEAGECDLAQARRTLAYEKALLLIANGVAAPAECAKEILNITTRPSQ